jgi:hypothetical protein
MERHMERREEHQTGDRSGDRTGGQGGGDPRSAEVNWVVIFLGAVGLFLVLYLSTLYLGHSLAS